VKELPAWTALQKNIMEMHFIYKIEDKHANKIKLSPEIGRPTPLYLQLYKYFFSFFPSVFPVLPPEARK